jgi:hypothetical protein
VPAQRDFNNPAQNILARVSEHVAGLHIAGIVGVVAKGNLPKASELFGRADLVDPLSGHGGDDKIFGQVGGRAKSVQGMCH